MIAETGAGTQNYLRQIAQKAAQTKKITGYTSI